MSCKLCDGPMSEAELYSYLSHWWRSESYGANHVGHLIEGLCRKHWAFFKRVVVMAPKPSDTSKESNL